MTFDQVSEVDKLHEWMAQTQQLLAAPSDILREQDVPAHFGTFYLRLGTVSKWRTGGSWSPAL